MTNGTAIILMNGNKVLLQHRDDKPDISYPDCWVLPGGHCKEGEEPSQTIVRELKEETSYNLSREPQLFRVVDDDGVRIAVFMDFYDGKQPINCHEGQAFEFKSAEEIANLKTEPGTLELVREALAVGVKMLWERPDAATYSSHDRIAKQLEMNAIAKYVKDGMAVLDVGCGDGETLLTLAERFSNSYFQGIDFSSEMIRLARAKSVGQWLISFHEGNITKDFAPIYNFNGYDLIYTERCLINLPDWKTQKRAMSNIAKCLKPGGLYVMLENSWDGLQYINDLREKLERPRIAPPGHNRYLRDEEIEEYRHAWTYQINGGPELPARGSLVLESVDDYSGVYYFLSRVIGPSLGIELPELSQLALRLPPIGIRGIGRIWLWRKV